MSRTRPVRKPKGVAPVQPVEKRPPVDLAALFRNPTAILEIPDPRADREFVDSGIRIEISSFKSQEALEVFQEFHEKLKLVKDEDEKQPLLSETLVRQLVAVTKRWWHDGETTDGLYYNGALLACTPENKRMVYESDGWDWLAGFVANRFLKEANFFGERPKTA